MSLHVRGATEERLYVFDVPVKCIKDKNVDSVTSVQMASRPASFLLSRAWRKVCDGSLVPEKDINSAFRNVILTGVGLHRRSPTSKECMDFIMGCTLVDRRSLTPVLVDVIIHFVKKEMKRLILAFIILFSQRILYRWC